MYNSFIMAVLVATLPEGSFYGDFEIIFNYDSEWEIVANHMINSGT